jgi:TATA-binding protein-associated factor Taf7
MFLWKFFDWVANNKTARWVLGIITGVTLYKIYERLRDNRIRKRAEERVIEKIEAKEDKLKEQANEAENRVTADLNTRSLQDVAANSPENLGPVRRD